MKIHRFLGNFNLDQDPIVLDQAELLNQFKNVLKLKVGEKVALGNGQKEEVLATIAQIQKSRIILKVDKKIKNKNESIHFAHLYCSILKKENFEWVVQKATEIGVSAITPLLTTRTIKQGIKLARLETIVREAAEQSERGIIPTINPIQNFKDLFNRPASGKEFNFLFDQSGDSEFLKNFKKHSFESLNLYIGPEGGWTEEEIKRAKGAGFKIVSLGQLNFRAETAAVISSYLLTH